MPEERVVRIRELQEQKQARAAAREVEALLSAAAHVQFDAFIPEAEAICPPAVVWQLLHDSRPQPSPTRTTTARTSALSQPGLAGS
jgi:hypothetical protein